MIKAKGLIADCKAGEVNEVEIDYDNSYLLEQELLDSLKPSEKEVLMAEVELNTLNLLLELEVI